VNDQGEEESREEVKRPHGITPVSRFYIKQGMGGIMGGLEG